MLSVGIRHSCGSDGRKISSDMTISGFDMMIFDYGEIMSYRGLIVSDLVMIKKEAQALICLDNSKKSDALPLAIGIQKHNPDRE